jgi:hypothetical protein
MSIDVFVKSNIASGAITNYCKWQGIDFDFDVDFFNGKYVKTKSVKKIINSEKVFTNRSKYKDLFIKLGSMRLVDTSSRSQIVQDPRLLVTWLHNPVSVAIMLLNEQPLFNAYMRNDSPKYSMSYIEQLYENQFSVDFNHLLTLR